jgi:magnesium transporter
MNGTNVFLPLVEKFIENDLDAAGRIFESLPEEEAGNVFQSLPPALAVRLIKNLQISFAAALLEDVDDAFLKEIVTRLDPQFAATILMHLPADARERMTQHLSGKLKDQVRELFEYPEESVGRIMTTDFLSFDKDVLASEAIDKIRQLAKKRYPSSYAYVTDDENRLIGY